MDYEQRFKELNKKRIKNPCCNGECFNNYISNEDTLICGKCEEEKHIDNFLESKYGYLCGRCESAVL